MQSHQSFKVRLETRTRALILWSAILVLAIFSGTTANAQFNASLRGTVSDPSGAVIPGATVTLTEKNTGQNKVAQSDGSGIYTFNRPLRRSS